jgi:biotin synthase-like enzyme
MERRNEGERETYSTLSALFNNSLFSCFSFAFHYLHPIAGTRFEPLKDLTAWHFVAIIFAIGIAGLIFKYIFEMPRYRDEE